MTQASFRLARAMFAGLEVREIGTMMVTQHEARQALLAFIEAENDGKFDISLDLRDGEIYFGLKIVRGHECSAERARYWLENYLYWSPGAGYRMDRKDGSVQLERIGLKPRQRD